MLLNAFNLLDFEPVMCYSFEEQQKVLANRKQEGKELFKEIVDGLTNDLVMLGFEKTYSSDIIIHTIAQNILIMRKLKMESIYNKLIVPDSKLVLDKNVITPCDSYGKSRNERHYEKVLIGEKIDPMFEKYLIKLQKEISNGLKSLGLHPTQLVERQKITIVKKLRQRYENSTSEISIEANKERSSFRKSDVKELINQK